MPRLIWRNIVRTAIVVIAAIGVTGLIWVILTEALDLFIQGLSRVVLT